MEMSARTAGKDSPLRRQESRDINERFVGECLKKIHAAKDAEEGLRRLLEFLGETLECERVYVFEVMDRQHICNTYEWCREGVPSGIQKLPYVAKKDLAPWYERLAGGEKIIAPDVTVLRRSDPLIYAILQPQGIRSLLLSPLLTQGKMLGLLGADNPPPEKMTRISILFDLLAYFVCSLIGQRELEKLREARDAALRPKDPPRAFLGKNVLLVDDSRELLRVNERVLRREGYGVSCAATLKEADEQLKKAVPDAIVMDVDLPDGNGIVFCRKLLQTVDIPVVFLTAHSDRKTLQEGQDAGGCAFLTKPYQLEELQSAVAAAVNGRDKQGRQKPIRAKTACL